MGAAFISALLAANAALFLSWCVLVVFDAGLQRAGLSRAWTLRRRLVSGAWAVTALVPVCLWALPALPVNATDWLVGQFLNGKAAMTGLSATDVARLIEVRDDVPRALAQAAGPVWQALVSAIVTAGLYRVIRVVQSAGQLRRMVMRARPVRQLGRLRVAVSTECTVPFAARGIWRVHVVMPAGLWISPVQRRMALAHELQHLRQGDPLLELAMALVSPLFALNPAFWALARRTRRLREHGCDAACVARADIDARNYALCLLDVARNAQARGPGTLTVAFLGRRQRNAASTRSQLGQRIEWIAAGPERRIPSWICYGAVGLFAAITIGAMLVMRAPDSWSHERLMLSSVVNLERLDAINTLSQRPLR